MTPVTTVPSTAAVLTAVVVAHRTRSSAPRRTSKETVQPANNRLRQPPRCCPVPVPVPPSHLTRTRLFGRFLLWLPKQKRAQSFLDMRNSADVSSSIGFVSFFLENMTASGDLRRYCERCRCRGLRGRDLVRCGVR